VSVQAGCRHSRFTAKPRTHCAAVRTQARLIFGFSYISTRGARLGFQHKEGSNAHHPCEYGDADRPGRSPVEGCTSELRTGGTSTTPQFNPTRREASMAKRQPAPSTLSRECPARPASSGSPGPGGLRPWRRPDRGDLSERSLPLISTVSGEAIGFASSCLTDRERGPLFADDPTRARASRSSFDRFGRFDDAARQTQTNQQHAVRRIHRFRQHEARSPSCSCSATTASRLRNAAAEKRAANYTEGVRRQNLGHLLVRSGSRSEVASRWRRGRLRGAGASSALILATPGRPHPAPPI